MSKRIHWRVYIKEWNTPHEIMTEYIGNMTREQIIEFYGLNEPDVEYYRIEVIESKEG